MVGILLVAATTANTEASPAASLTIVDLMNAVLIIISALFIIAIVDMLLNKKLRDLVRSAHFFQMKKITAAWVILGAAIILYALNEVLFTLGLFSELSAYKFIKTVFGVLVVGSTFLLYTVLRKYVRQFSKKKERKKKAKEAD
jgi:hypothetical protein